LLHFYFLLLNLFYFIEEVMKKILTLIGVLICFLGFGQFGTDVFTIGSDNASNYGGMFVKIHRLHMACGGFEALSCPQKPKLATERKPCW
jgi:hypothetical protein